MVSEVVRRPQSPVAQRVAKLDRASFAVSIVVAVKLRYEVQRKGSARLSAQLDAVMQGVDVYPLDLPVDQHYGEIRDELERMGLPIDRNDLLIAAHECALRATPR